MPKNILIFSDGTGQAGGLKPDQHLSNIYKLFRATRVGPDSPVDPAAQIAFYDAGLGTENDEGRVPDRYGRTVGRVSWAGTDANAEQVARGMAWVFGRYVRRDSPLYPL